MPDAGRAGDLETSSLRKNYSYVEDRLMSIEAEMPGPSVEHATYPDVTTFVYDSSGNLVSEDTDMRFYSAEAPWDQLELARKKMRSYYGADERLRLIQRYDATYDTANVANSTRQGAVEEYRYDPLGRRVMAWIRADTATLCNRAGCADHLNTFVWNGDHLVQEQYRGNGNVYVHGLGVDRPLKIGSMIPHADYRGVYDAGNLSTGEAISANYPGRNVGAFHDEGTPRLTGQYASLLQGGVDQSGLAYRRNRYYDPATGRFTQQDPIGMAGGLNLYGYANGDPVNFSDPFGLSACTPMPDCLGGMARLETELRGVANELKRQAKEFWAEHGDQVIDVAVIAMSRGQPRLRPNPAAVGPHSTFRVNGQTGKINHYETWRPQTNPQNPAPWESVIRFDGAGSDPHFNKATQQPVPAPHVQGPNIPGGVRPAAPWEIPPQ